MSGSVNAFRRSRNSILPPSLPGTQLGSDLMYRVIYVLKVRALCTRVINLYRPWLLFDVRLFLASNISTICREFCTDRASVSIQIALLQAILLSTFNNDPWNFRIT